MAKYISSALVSVLLLTSTCFAQNLSETKIVKQLLVPARFPGARVEVRQRDNSRVDIVTDSLAIEVDRPHKWTEAIGQSLHYARLTKLKPGIVLIVPRDAKPRDWVRCCDCAVQCGKIGIHFEIFIY